MTWFPSSPISRADTLHKYVALNGLWFICAIILLIGALHYQNFEHQEFNKKQSWLFSKQESLRKFEGRLGSLKKRDFSENVLPGISDRYSPKDEGLIVENLAIAAREEILSLKEQIKNPPSNLFPVLAHFHFESVLVGIFIASLLLTYVGFRGWFKFQRVTDEIQNLELELKRLQLKETKRTRVKRRG